MRITNSMISNSARQHISTAKNKMSTAESQYTTQKKIQRASDDPTIASRSLKFRNTLSQLTQYVEKNVQDAMDWMDSTESAMKTAGSILTNMKEKLNQGANGHLEATERTSILTQLEQYATSIFADSANQDYAGRYLFTGYRTDTSLLFPTKTEDIEYQIQEKFDMNDIELVHKVFSNVTYQPATTAAGYAAQESKINNCYRIQLAYDRCSDSPITGGTDSFHMDIKDKDGNIVNTISDSSNTVGKADKDDIYACDVATYNAHYGTSYDAIYIPENGEILLSDSFYADISQNEYTMTVDYAKKSFEAEDIRPEMYFKCDSYNTVSMKTINYADPDDQSINYEVNIRQSIGVNTQGKDAFDTAIYRALDHIRLTIDGVNQTENAIADVEKKIANLDRTSATYKDDLETLNTLKDSLTDEKELRVSVMNEAFGAGLTMVDKVQQVLNVAISDLGARYNRLELTYDKLLSQQLTTEEQLSDNEDIELSDAIINLTEADNLYQSSLSATARILGNTLLDYI